MVVLLVIRVVVVVVVVAAAVVVVVEKVVVVVADVGFLRFGREGSLVVAEVELRVVSGRDVSEAKGEPAGTAVVVASKGRRRFVEAGLALAEIVRFPADLRKKFGVLQSLIAECKIFDPPHPSVTFLHSLANLSMKPLMLNFSLLAPIWRRAGNMALPRSQPGSTLPPPWHTDARRTVSCQLGLNEH